MADIDMEVEATNYIESNSLDDEDLIDYESDIGDLPMGDQSYPSFPETHENIDIDHSGTEQIVSMQTDSFETHEDIDLLNPDLEQEQSIQPSNTENMEDGQHPDSAIHSGDQGWSNHVMTDDPDGVLQHTFPDDIPTQHPADVSQPLIAYAVDAAGRSVNGVTVDHPIDNSLEMSSISSAVRADDAPIDFDEDVKSLQHTQQPAQPEVHWSGESNHRDIPQDVEGSLNQQQFDSNQSQEEISKSTRAENGEAMPNDHEGINQSDLPTSRDAEDDVQSLAKDVKNNAVEEPLVNDILDHGAEGINSASGDTEFPSITVHYQGEDFPLFATDSEGFFSELSTMDKSITELLAGFRIELATDVDEAETLVLQIDELGLEFSETDQPGFSSSSTLRQIHEVFDILAKNQDPDSSRSMYMNLFTKSNCSRRFEFLMECAMEGKSLDEVLLHFDQPTTVGNSQADEFSNGVDRDNLASSDEPGTNEAPADIHDTAEQQYPRTLDETNNSDKIANTTDSLDQEATTLAKDDPAARNRIPSAPLADSEQVVAASPTREKGTQNAISNANANIGPTNTSSTDGPDPGVVNQITPVKGDGVPLIEQTQAQTDPSEIEAGHDEDQVDCPTDGALDSSKDRPEEPRVDNGTGLEVDYQADQEVHIEADFDADFDADHATYQEEGQEDQQADQTTEDLDTHVKPHADGQVEDQLDLEEEEHDEDVEQDQTPEQEQEDQREQDEEAGREEEKEELVELEEEQQPVDEIDNKGDDQASTDPSTSHTLENERHPDLAIPSSPFDIDPAGVDLDEGNLQDVEDADEFAEIDWRDEPDVVTANHENNISGEKRSRVEGDEVEADDTQDSKRRRP